MKVKLDDYEIRVLINGLFQCRCDYNPQTYSVIDDFLLQLVKGQIQSATTILSIGGIFILF